jgi:hypothetical protein
LFSTGLASLDVLKELLMADGFNVEALTLLMLKYGLAMSWPRKDLMKYLIPSLFSGCFCSVNRKGLGS